MALLILNTWTDPGTLAGQYVSGHGTLTEEGFFDMGVTAGLRPLLYFKPLRHVGVYMFQDHGQLWSIKTKRRTKLLNCQSFTILCRDSRSDYEYLLSHGVSLVTL